MALEAYLLLTAVRICMWPLKLPVSTQQFSLFSQSRKTCVAVTLFEMYTPLACLRVFLTYALEWW